MSQPTPRPSQDRAPLGVLFWMLVNAKTSAEQAAHECERALKQLAYICGELSDAAGSTASVTPGAPQPDG